MKVTIVGADNMGRGIGTRAVAGGHQVVDITNPLNTETWDSLATAPGSSSAEETQQLVPEGTAVVKARSTSARYDGPSSSSSSASCTSPSSSRSG
jgi:predicted dinucleotide-binding enzyme